MQKKEINIELGMRLQLVREQRGYTQEKLAELLDVGVQHISNIERGVTGISLTALSRVCGILEISSDFLLFGENKQTKEKSLDEQIGMLTPEQATIVRQSVELLLRAFKV